jgi:myosin heavy subunit
MPSMVCVVHYAGTVSYNVTGWLEKNKDPLNDTVIEQLKSGTNRLIVHVFRDHPGQGREEGEDTAAKGKGKKKKGGGAKTVSTFYTQQLNSLMATLHATEPHFIRCIIPNNHKQPGVIEPGLVLHQLTCNGVLEGIRICMRGFPNRMPYNEFMFRYGILETAGKGPSTAATAAGADLKKATEAICSGLLNKEKFRIGHIKVFFRAGVLGYLEEARDETVTRLTRILQGACLGHLRRQVYARRKLQRDLLVVIQRVFRKFLALRHWGWFAIIQKTRPLIGVLNIEEEIRILEEAAGKAVDNVDFEVEEKKRLEVANTRLMEEKMMLLKRIENEQGELQSLQERQAKGAVQKADMELQIADFRERIQEEEARKEELIATKKAIEAEVSAVRGDCSDLEVQVQKVEQERANLDHQMRNLNDDIQA